jgi:tetratricopeptide (TPR) repeat protein
MRRFSSIVGVAAACVGLDLRPAHAAEIHEDAVAVFESGDMESARPALERAHLEAPDDLDITLLYGISLYRLGKLDAAEPLVRRAAESDDEETRASAELFLGLIARDRGDTEEARDHLDRVASSHVEDLASTGADLSRAFAPRRAGVYFLVRSEYDSDVALLPIGRATADFGGDADADLFMLASANLRPFERFGLSLSDTASYRRYLHRNDFDLFANVASARWDHADPSDRLAASYGFEVMTLGGPLLALGHVADAGWRHALYEDFGAAIRYQLRHRDYDQAAYGVYSGTMHTGTLEATWGTPDRPFEIDLAYQVSRELLADPGFIATAQGARLFARGSIGVFFAMLTATALLRDFDQGRRDQQLLGDVTFGADVGWNFAIVAGATALRNFSNVSDYDYAKWTANLGVQFFAP